MNLLSRHLLASVLLTCGLAVGLFEFILIAGNAIQDLLDHVLAGQFPLGTVLRLVGLLVPYVITYALPLGTLCGVLLVLGRLSADNEITAMRAVGRSVGQISRPILLFGALGAVFTLFVNFVAMPHARVQYHREYAEALRSNPLSFLVPRTFISDFPGYVLYVGDKHGSEMRDFWLWQLDSQQRVVSLVRAEAGKFDYDEATDTLLLTLTHATAERRDSKNPEEFGNAPLTFNFEQTSERLSLDRLLSRRGGFRQKLQWMTYPELQAQLAKFSQPVPPADRKEQARDRMKVQITIQEKITQAVAVFSFAALAIPLGIRISRRETSANLGLAVLLAGGYYFLTVMIGWLDRHPEYRPDLLQWLPNVLFLGLALWLFRRIDRN
ncbi:LptF/LptG family permease [Horticoccus luteus]|uniref:LptF/LptG family permease n=1 Tax=Horticoccus luteus TaxID=2862869 RepID=A0A8F9XJR1_9BACT|nr:LptF/LptG family permease [Horticoccus luteus]QYM78938.1 LptF/LptG family permease [Horticoccus luteus]